MTGDIFATKGTEYLLVVVYFALLIALVNVFAPKVVATTTPRVKRTFASAIEWFSLADGYFFHPGHAWAASHDGEIVTVGLDDFAAKLLGPPDSFELPAVGTDVAQGDPGWAVRVGDRKLTMLSPVEGEVVAVNPAALVTPRLATNDPYGEGWLLKVRVPNRKASLKNLMSGELAKVWMKNTAERLSRLPATGLGVVMADGGLPMRGFGRQLGPYEWQEVTRDFFLGD
ncbi:MAG: glycine cleavage system protein H [Gemmatimonadales bacterium]